MRIEEERTKFAERKNQEKSYFIACAIHDVSDPATAILMLIRSAIVAFDAQDFALAKTNLNRIEEAGQRMNNLFTTVLDLSRID